MNRIFGGNIREFIDVLNQRGELRKVEGVDPDLEIGGLSELVAMNDGPALLFDGITGYPKGYRLLTNFMSSPGTLSAVLDMPNGSTPLEIVKAAKEVFKSTNRMQPIELETSPVKENVLTGQNVDLDVLPSPKWHEFDGGKYIGTACAVVTKDPEENWVNVGTYRSQVHDKKSLGMLIDKGHHGGIIQEKYWAKGESCPIAICIGVSPALLVSSFLGVPWGVSEYEWAGGLTGKPLELIRGVTTGLPVPAASEVIIEGFVAPPKVESKLEGPFGEVLGYYASGARPEPVVKVKSLMYRNNPILTGAPPLRPPATSTGSYYFRSASVWNELDKLGLPGVMGVWRMPAGGPYLITVISIKQLFPGHAKQVAQAALAGREGGYLSKFVIVIDDDLDPTDVGDVMWAVATRCEPSEDVDILKDCWGSYIDARLSPERRASGDIRSSKMLLIACKPYGWRKEFPRTNSISVELRAKLEDKYRQVLQKESIR